MELGEKIRRARLEAGLSQRQLCGEEITRNMLSLIENGAAKPSVKTLRYLADQLGKPLSFFLDEAAPEHDRILEAAHALDRAEEALAAGKDIYAAQLLEKVTWPRLRREKLLLCAKLPGAKLTEVAAQLPSLDEELLLRAEAALADGLADRCEKLLLAVEDPASPRWQLLMGRLCVTRLDWARAAAYLEQAENACPEAVPLLEVCFRELGDYRRAYEYACKQK